jgi:integrase
LGRFYNIKLEPEALRLIEKYKGKKYLLWFADHCYEGTAKVEHARQTVFQYKNQDAFTRMLNDNLTLIHDDLELGLKHPLTTYYVRHSFSTIMREIDISTDDISLCLGHVSPEQHMKVTGIYINEDFIRADQANRELINFANSVFCDGKSWKDHKEKEKKEQEKTEQASKKRTKKNPAT